MNWIDRLLMRIAHFLWRKLRPKRKENPYYFVIENAVGDPYLVRYKLFWCPWFKIFLHHILRSDEDADCHCHPWNFVSIILWEGYLEVLSGDVIRWIRPGNVVRHRATDAHRLILSRPAWTLVFVTGKKRKWGFHTKDGWVGHAAYFDKKFGPGKWVSY
jgi:hypothetical protein